MKTLMMPLRDRKICRARNQQGFTFIELAIVILIIGLLSILVVSRNVGFSYWKEEGFLRNLSETLNFLHHQAIVDQAFYRFEVDIDNNQYVIGILKPEGESEEILNLSSDLGNISLELAAFLNPSMGETATMIAPPTMPSLAVPVIPPQGVVFEDVQTPRGKETDGKAYVMFSPRGFSEFAVLHLRLSTNEPITILVNPFTGLTKIIRDYKDFTWQYGREKQGNS